MCCGLSLAVNIVLYQLMSSAFELSGDSGVQVWTLSCVAIVFVVDPLYFYYLLLCRNWTWSIIMSLSLRLLSLTML